MHALSFFAPWQFDYFSELGRVAPSRSSAADEAGIQAQEAAPRAAADVLHERKSADQSQNVKLEPCGAGSGAVR